MARTMLAGIEGFRQEAHRAPIRGHVHLFTGLDVFAPGASLLGRNAFHPRRKSSDETRKPRSMKKPQSRLPGGPQVKQRSPSKTVQIPQDSFNPSRRALVRAIPAREWGRGGNRRPGVREREPEWSGGIPRLAPFPFRAPVVSEKLIFSLPPPFLIQCCRCRVSRLARC